MMIEQITQATPLLVFSNLLIIMGIYMLLKKAAKYPFKLSSTRRNMAVILMLLFVLFAFWGADYFHYLEMYPLVLEGEEFHLEYVYVWIIQNLSMGYTSFRFIVWGGALFLYLLLIKRLPINKNLALFLFGTLCLIWFSYARSSLAMVMVYLGNSLLYKPYRNKILSFLLGWGIIFCAIFFHKSAVFIVAISIIVYFLKNINRKVALSIIGVCVLLILLKIDIIISAMLNMSSGEESVLSQTITSGQNYALMQIADRGVTSLVLKIMECIFYYLIAWCCYRFCVGKEKHSEMVSFMYFMILIVLFSSIFLMGLQIEATIIHERLIRFGAIPATIVMAYFWQHGYYLKVVKTSYRLFFSVTLMSILYAIYDANFL